MSQRCGQREWLIREISCKLDRGGQGVVQGRLSVVSIEFVKPVELKIHIAVEGEVRIGFPVLIMGPDDLEGSLMLFAIVVWKLLNAVAIGDLEISPVFVLLRIGRSGR